MQKDACRTQEYSRKTRPQWWARAPDLLGSTSAPSALVQLQNVASTGLELQRSDVLVAPVTVQSSRIPTARSRHRNRDSSPFRDRAGEQIRSPDRLALRGVRVELGAYLVALGQVEVVDGRVGQVLHLELDGALSLAGLDGDQASRRTAAARQRAERQRAGRHEQGHTEPRVAGKHGHPD